MKNFKLLAVAIVLVVIAMVLSTNKTKVIPINPLVGKGIIASNELDKIKNISLITSQGRIDIKHDKSNWRMPELHDMRVDNNRIEELFQQLNGSKLIELVSKNPKRYQDMGVSDSSGTYAIGKDCAQVIMANEQNQNISNTYLGSARKAKMVDGSQGFGNDGQYIRHKDSASVYLTSNFIRIENRKKNWLDKKLLKSPVDNIKKISWKYSDNKTFHIERSAASESLELTDIDKDHITNKSKVDMISKLPSNMMFDDYIATDSPSMHPSLAKPSECLIEGFNGLKLSMKISSAPVELPGLSKAYVVLLTSEYKGTDTSLKSYADELNTLSSKLLYALRESRLKPFLVNKIDLQKSVSKPAPKTIAKSNASGSASVPGSSSSVGPGYASENINKVANTKNARNIDKVSASHILIAFKGSSRSKATRSEKEAKKLADELLGKIKKGEDFNKLAKENSDCPSGKSADGSLGEFKRGVMAKEFETTAFSLKVGEISGVTKTSFGYHIIRRNK